MRLGFDLEVAGGDVERGRVDHAGDPEHRPAVVEPDLDLVTDQDLALRILDLAHALVAGVGEIGRDEHVAPVLEQLARGLLIAVDKLELDHVEERVGVDAQEPREGQEHLLHEHRPLFDDHVDRVRGRVGANSADVLHRGRHVRIDLLEAPDVALRELLGKLPAGAEARVEDDQPRRLLQ